MKLTMVYKDKERCNVVPERAQKQLDCYLQDVERRLCEKMELMSENKEANIKAVKQRLHQHVLSLFRLFYVQMCGKGTRSSANAEKPRDACACRCSMLCCHQLPFGE